MTEPTDKPETISHLRGPFVEITNDEDSTVLRIGRRRSGDGFLIEARRSGAVSLFPISSEEWTQLMRSLDWI